MNTVIAGCYIFPAVTMLMVGRENPVIALAQTDAASVFFVALTLFAIGHQIMAWCTFSTCRAAAVNVLHSGVHLATMSMVAQAGQSSDWPVSDATGILTPVWAIASERENSSDSIFAKRRRMPSWLRPQPQNTQNPRSPNSATTVAVRFTVRRWWRYIFTLIYWPLISMRSRYICRTYSLTSATILRL
ncbi:TPA: ash family protein [Salmonella enterica subsp. diarizonae]|nr:ash family protein [Salmonella enterica subsp. diarizonae]